MLSAEAPVVPTGAGLELPDEQLAELARLKAERDIAWAAFNPKAGPGKNKDGQLNDWPRFAIANSKWLAYYKRLYGKDPEPDEAKVVSYRWWCWNRYDKKPGEKKPPESVWQYIHQQEQEQ